MLFGWSKPKCPIAEDDRLWIERRLTWLGEQFGRERLQFGTVVLPTADFFPETYHPTEEGVGALLRRVCEYVGVETRRVRLAFCSSRKPAVIDDALIDWQTGAASGLDEESRSITIWLDTGRLDDPYLVVATLAHELGHVHLLGDRRLTAEAPDGEPLTNLLSVFLGLGLFTANANVLDFNPTISMQAARYVRSQGYLTAPLYGYALALCAWCRRDDPCPWQRFLRPDVRSIFDKSLSYLRENGAPRFPNCTAGPPAPPGAFPPRADEGAGVAESEPAQSAAENQSEEESPQLVDSPSVDVDELEDGADADGFFQLGWIHYRAGQFAEAVAAATEALTRTPDDAEVYALRAAAHVALEQYREALPDAEQAIELDPGDRDARRARGIALLHTGEPERAITDFDFLIKENRHQAEGYYHRGLAYAALGDHQRALDNYGKAITKAPNFAETYFARYQTYKDLGINEKAEADLKEGLRRRAQLNREV